MDREFKTWRASTIPRLLLIFPLFLASCRVTPQSVALCQKTHTYDRLNIIYRADSPVGPLFTPDTKIPIESATIVQAAAEFPSESPFPELNWSKAELRIECPHPDGRRDYARVTLCLLPMECGCECDRLTWEGQRKERMGLQNSRRTALRERWFYEPFQPETPESTYELDLPRSELDLIVSDLNSHGFFAESNHPNGSETELEVRLNRNWTSKSWGYERSLDLLTTRVYEQGTAVSPPKPPANATGLAPNAFTLFGSERNSADPR